MKGANVHLFVYGSLMFEEVWSRLVRGSYVKRTARLHGFSRRKVRDDVYPVIFRSHEPDWVDGLVYLHVTDEDIRRLDFFEGDVYDRQNHTVLVEQAEKIVAAVYVLKDDYYHMTDATDWDPAWFAREGLGLFLGRHRGFR
ncbi:MAG: gamma-glutamylcyclotransferase [Sedimentisphaerales bacterium]|nr:gamma-glutamylcyclotransferase [Sedimentisphaerales bacterium]